MKYGYKIITICLILVISSIPALLIHPFLSLILLISSLVFSVISPDFYIGGKRDGERVKNE